MFLLEDVSLYAKIIGNVDWMLLFLLYMNYFVLIKFFFFKPPITEIINIPRSDPNKKTKGRLYEFWEGATVFNERGFLLKVKWSEFIDSKEVLFEKFITVKKFLELNPQYLGGAAPQDPPPKYRGFGGRSPLIPKIDLKTFKFCYTKYGRKL